MFYVICPTCLAHVEISGEAVGDDRTDPFNTICCIECGTGFDYDADEVIHDEGPSID